MSFVAATAMDGERNLEMRHPRSRIFWLFLYLLLSSAATGQTPPSNGGDFSQGSTDRIPDHVILVKGAWSSASDTVTPLPEGGRLDAANVRKSRILASSCPCPRDGYKSMRGRRRQTVATTCWRSCGRRSPRRASRGALCSSRRRTCFSPPPRPRTRCNSSTTRGITCRRIIGSRLRRGRSRCAGRTFVRFDYVSPVAGLHWSILATEVRCHVVEFVVTSADTRLVEALTHGLSQMKLGDSDSPVCLANYATPANVLHREDPIFSEHKYNPIPVRVIIDREGKVKHIHFLSAFPAQSQALTTALMQWRFKPYLRDGQPVEVETGILFGRAPRGGL